MEAKLLSIGLDEKTASSTLNNGKLTARLESILTMAGYQGSFPKAIGTRLYQFATKAPSSDFADAHAATVLGYITEGKLASTKQVDCACTYLKKKKAWDQSQFETDCGVGIVVTDEDVKNVVTRVVQENKEQLVVQRYKMLGRLLGALNKELKWGNGRVLKQEFDAQILALLGPKDERDKPKKKKKEKKKKQEKKKEAEEEPDDFKKSGRVIKEWSVNTPEQLERHLKERRAKIVTRFPPEPNGFLHVGHAKAMYFNFQAVAKKHGGVCIMRFDDTNPTAEKKQYIDSIHENISWMGHSPCCTTYSSDYFPQLYELAIKMIKKGYAYICHQTKAEIEESRKPNPCIPSPYRERSVEENLRLFQRMKDGLYDEGEAVLRMKGDLASSNPQMWDMVAYRIMFHAHPMTGDEWCIYPSYDYTHCIVDSLENITHSLCTLEFEMRRESYFWLLWVLDLYKPVVWEYSRLNLQYNVLSKRKLIKLIKDKHVRGWDDPRLLTVNGLRRRGFRAEAINTFCDQLGVTRNANSIPWHVLEHYVRTDLEPIATRAYCVVDPILVTIVNFPANTESVSKMVPNHPHDPSQGSREVHFTRTVFIDRDDFRVEDSKGYYGLAPNKEVHLKYGYNIKCLSYTLNNDGSVKELKCKYDPKNNTKCKGKVHWVSAEQGKNVPVEVRQYNYLFSVPEPGKDKNVDYLTELNPESEVIRSAYADLSVANAEIGKHFQFERRGFFIVDLDSTPGKLVFNRSCGLKMNAKNKAAARRS